MFWLGGLEPQMRAGMIMQWKKEAFVDTALKSPYGTLCHMHTNERTCFILFQTHRQTLDTRKRKKTRKKGNGTHNTSSFFSYLFAPQQRTVQAITEGYYCYSIVPRNIFFRLDFCDSIRIQRFFDFLRSCKSTVLMPDAFQDRIESWSSWQTRSRHSSQCLLLEGLWGIAFYFSITLFTLVE